MAHKFTVWVQQPVVDTNIQSADSFNSDSQTENGFQAGATASAIRVNTALRQANLVATALMNAILDSSSSASVETSVDSLTSEITARLAVQLGIVNGSALGSIMTRGGNNSIGSGALYSAALGQNNNLTHQNAFAFGAGLVSGRALQILVGRYNQSDSNALFVVGNGTSSTKNNAFQVNDDGSVQVPKTPVNSTDVARKTDLPVGADSNPTNVSDTGSAGSAATFSRADHTHKGVGSIKVNSTSKSYGDVGPIYAPVDQGSAGQILVASGQANTPPAFSNENVGNYRKPIYLLGGVPTGMSFTIGSLNQPIYMDGGELKAGNSLFVDGTVTSPTQVGLFAITIRKNNTDQYTTVTIRIGRIGPNDTSTIFTSSLGVLNSLNTPYDTVWVNYRLLDNTTQFRIGAYPTAASNFTIVKVVKLTTMAWE